MNRRKYLLAVLAIFTTWNSLARAAPPRLGGPLVDGSVIRTRGCGSHFFIAYLNEYVLAELMGGEMVQDLDVLQVTDDVSTFEREGRMTVTNLVTGRPLEIVIEQALMNQSQFAQKVIETCR